MRLAISASFTGFAERILDDLAWLGIDWDEGPDRGGPHAPGGVDVFTVAMQR